MTPFVSKAMHRGSISPSSSSPRGKPVSKVRKYCGVEACYDTKACRVVIEGLEIQIQDLLQSSAVEDARQSSHDKWRSSKPGGEWREISLEIDALGSAVKEKKHTLKKSCKESVRRESGQSKMLESAANDAKIEDNARNRIRKTLKQLGKEEAEVSEARALLEDMQQTVDEAEARASDTKCTIPAIMISNRGFFIYTQNSGPKQPASCKRHPNSGKATIMVTRTEIFLLIFPAMKRRMEGCERGEEREKEGWTTLRRAVMRSAVLCCGFFCF